MYRIINSAAFLRKVIHEKDITVPFKLTIKILSFSEAPTTHFIPLSDTINLKWEVDVSIYLPY